MLIPANATSLPATVTSPPANITLAPANTASSPVQPDGTTTAAPSANSKVNLGFKLQRSFTSQLLNKSSPEFVELATTVKAAVSIHLKPYEVADKYFQRSRFKCRNTSSIKIKENKVYFHCTRSAKVNMARPQMNYRDR